MSDYFSNLRNQLELNRDNLKKSIDLHYDNLLKEIDKKEAESNGSKSREQLDKSEMSLMFKFLSDWDLDLKNVRQEKQYWKKMNKSIVDKLLELKLNIMKFKYKLLNDETITIQKPSSILFRNQDLFGKVLIKNQTQLSTQDENFEFIILSHDYQVSILDNNQNKIDLFQIDKSIGIINKLWVIPNNKLLVCTDNAVNVYETFTGVCLRTFYHEDSFLISNELCKLDLEDYFFIYQNGDIIKYNLNNNKPTSMRNIEEIPYCASVLADFIVIITQTNFVYFNAEKDFKIVKKVANKFQCLRISEIPKCNDLLVFSDDNKVRRLEYETRDFVFLFEEKYSINSYKTLTMDMVVVGTYDDQSTLLKLWNYEKNLCVFSHRVKDMNRIFEILPINSNKLLCINKEKLVVWSMDKSASLLTMNKPLCCRIFI